MFRANQVKVLFSVLVVVGFYQNCAPANFQATAVPANLSQGPESTGGMVLTTNVPLTGSSETGTPGGTIVANGGVSGSGSTGGSVSGQLPVNGGTSGTSGGTGGTSGTNDLPPGSKEVDEEDGGYDTQIPSQVVECEVHSPSIKVILATDFKTSHSNASSTRVCMSSNACLKMINAYAADRGCTLDPGAPTTPNSSTQCTRIFPGSRGTCKNAKKVSDAFIHELLVNMAKK